MGRSILIVDDSPSVRRALVRLLADGGFEVCGEAESGSEGVEKAQALNPGLIVMDLSMPGMDGIEAARRIRLLLPMIPIIILSNYAGLFPEQETESIGIAAIVSKAECSSVLLHVARNLFGQAA